MHGQSSNHNQSNKKEQGFISLLFLLVCQYLIAQVLFTYFIDVYHYLRKSNLIITRTILRLGKNIMPKEYKLISLDTSSTISGYSVFSSGLYKYSGVFDYSKKSYKEQPCDEDKLNKMVLSILSLLDKEKPGTVVIEMTVVERNAKTQRLLSEIVGSVRGWAYINNAEFVEYRPSVWRKLICGIKKIPIKRDDCKAWSVGLLQDKIVGIDDNEADSVLIGIARFIDLLGGSFEYWCANMDIKQERKTG